MAAFSDLVGKTITSITADEDASGNDILEFVCSDGAEYTMEHSQEGDEEFEYLLHGSLSDATGSEILTAAKVEYPTCFTPEGEEVDTSAEFFTWTLFNMYTVKGTCDIRWFGNSSSAYTGRVEFNLGVSA